MKVLTDKLMKKYQSIQSEHGLPQWAYQLPAPIPFIGNNYGSKLPKTVVYASAENLTYLRNDPDASLHRFSEEEARGRHRIFYSKYPNEKFPFIHLQPINNGSLLTTSMLIHHLLDTQFSMYSPHEYIESIACANIGKFSINEKTNVDYASNTQYLKESIKYLLADLEELKPEVIILPKSMYKSVKSIIAWEKVFAQAGIEHPVKVICVPQITPTVINCHLKRKVKANLPLSQTLPFELKELITSVHDYEKKINMPVYAEWVCTFFKDEHKTISAG